MLQLTPTKILICLALSAKINALAVRGTPKEFNAKAWSPVTSSEVSPTVKSNVTTTIYQWISDIETVNTFVDTNFKSESPAAISSQAAVAFKAAQGEAASNTILQQDVKLSASGQNAAQALLAQFAVIGPAINDTIYHPNNVEKNVAAVNKARCPAPGYVGAIALEGEVQQAAASAVGINVQPPPTPTACNGLKPWTHWAR